MNQMSMEKVVTYCKEYGFIFQGSEIYGGLANTWDYGPLGTRLKNNIKDAWRKRFIQEMRNSYEVDADILMHPKVWYASGHVDSFNDPLVDCKQCKKRYRLDTLINDFDDNANADYMSEQEMVQYINNNIVLCPNCGGHEYSDIRKFNLMFETYRGVTEESKMKIYLRPENAQGEYVNFLNVQRSMRTKLPFSIGQIGKAFRNEITPGNFIFRTIEFDQMEHQTFCKEGEDGSIYEKMKEYALHFFLDLGISRENLRFKDHEKLAFYAKAACDIEFLFPFGWGEINGTHNRTNYDLNKHQVYSGKSMEYMDSQTSQKYIPYIVESTIGADRATLAVLLSSYESETLDNGTTRDIMRFKPAIAPIKCAIMPLNKKLHSEKAYEIMDVLNKHFMVIYDETQSIGKRYRRQDAIGTPYCITVDDETLQKDTVTLRDRDTMEQITINVEDLVPFLDTRVRG